MDNNIIKMSVEIIDINGVCYNITSNELQWKIIYLNNNIIYFDKSEGKTANKNNIFTSLKFLDMMYFIIENDLNVIDFELKNYTEIVGKIQKENSPKEEEMIEFLQGFNIID